MRSTAGRAVLTGVCASLVLTGCGGAAPASSAGVDIVASTDVWGSVAAAVGGDGVHVTSIITDPSADPHSFEATARTQLAVSRADLVLENGGGYDDFMHALVQSTKTAAPVIDAVQVSGKAAGGRAPNEHVWYDFPTVAKVAARIVSRLVAIDPANAATYRSNGAAFATRIQGLIEAEAVAQPRTRGSGVAITEPVPGYLLDALGADVRTPTAFSAAIEEGGDVPPAVLQQTLALFSGHRVRALVYNAQSTGPETEQVLKAAREHGVAVVPVTETLPAGTDYVGWMTGTLAAVTQALMH